MQSKIEVVKSLLKTYAKENGVIVRSTSDLSPLEGWLLNRLAERILINCA